MRLLNVKTFQLQEFAEFEQPPYVITSHCWGNDEATYKDVRKGRNKDAAGFKKIQSFCKFTGEYVSKPGYGPIQWIWIDTCCIDKSSSAELTEAINSMFRWYAEAELCLAFLHDVKHENTRPAGYHDQRGWIEAQMRSTQRESIKQSVWFTRGWTLQELLAPSVVLFVDETWTLVGHKGSKSPQELLQHRSSNLNDLLSDVTGIPSDILEDFTRAKSVSLEDKQRWMQHRTTTRVEDMAYCQLGIFGVFMPLIYGERDQAMERLRAEVKRKYGEDLQDASSVKEDVQPAKEAPAPHVTKTAKEDDASRLDALTQRDQAIERRYQATERLRTEVKRNYGEDLHDASRLKENVQHAEAQIPPYVTKTAKDDAASRLDAIAQWNYEARETNEIDFHDGERITHIEKVDVDWWSGRNEKGEEGLFPANHVELVGLEDVASAVGKNAEKEYRAFTDKAYKVETTVAEKDATSSHSDRCEAKETATHSVNPTLSLHDKLASLNVRAEESARLATIRREQQPKPDSLKGFRWLSGLFSTKDEPKNDGKIWVSTLPKLERVERQAEKQNGSDSSARANPTQPITRRSTSDSKASSTTRARRQREIRRSERELSKGHRTTRDTVADTRESTSTSSASAWAEVCYSYSAAENNEIDLIADEIIRDIEKIDKGWWIGTNSKDERGLFPSNYVRSL